MITEPILKNVADIENGAKANPKAKYLSRRLIVVIGFKLMALSSHAVFKIL